MGVALCQLTRVQNSKNTQQCHYDASAQRSSDRVTRESTVSLVARLVGVGPIHYGARAVRQLCVLAPSRKRGIHAIYKNICSISGSNIALTFDLNLNLNFGCCARFLSGTPVHTKRCRVTAWSLAHGTAVCQKRAGGGPGPPGMR